MASKVLLIIRDGWGYSRETRGNAIRAAKTPNDDRYTKEYPTSVIKCTGNDVGNPDGVQGGSEVGHLTIGAGRIVWQPYELINREIKSGSFFRNEALHKERERSPSCGFVLRSGCARRSEAYVRPSGPGEETWPGQGVHSSLP